MPPAWKPGNHGQGLRPRPWDRLRGAVFPKVRLRWQLTFAFMLVSVIPVLLASYVAAEMISSRFERSRERWLNDTARLIVRQLLEAEEEARLATAIFANSLTHAQTLEGDLAGFSADLLVSTGYDLVALYDPDGHVVLSQGLSGDTAWLPRQDGAGFYMTMAGGTPVLLLGSSHRFLFDGRPYIAFVADKVNDRLIAAAQTISSLQVSYFGARGTPALSFSKREGLPGFSVPLEALARLEAGEQSVSAMALPDDRLASGFAALRDRQGALVGIIAARLASNTPVLSNLGLLQLFVVLSLCSGLLSFVVALVVSARISRPVRDFTAGLRQVASGNYATRVRESGDGELAELTGGFNAMTEQLERLRSMEAEMRRRETLATLGEAATTIAHEIRNPLGIIKTSSQVIRGRDGLSPGTERLLDFVLDEVKRIDHLVQDLIDYARPRALRLQVLDLADDVIAGVADFAEAELSRRGITCAILKPSLPVRIAGDAELLHQAFLNVLINAMEAMPDGGEITIRVSREAAVVLASVEDTGKGIAPEIVDRLFDPFVTSKLHGTGLGLARVRAVVERHGGRIEADNRIGGGARFVFHFPLAEEKGDGLLHPDR